MDEIKRFISSRTFLKRDNMNSKLSLRHHELKRLIDLVENNQNHIDKVQLLMDETEHYKKVKDAPKVSEQIDWEEL